MRKLFILLAVAMMASNVCAQNSGPVSAAVICRDLVGHSLSEGTPEGYYPSDWKWTIEQGEISHFRILTVRENTATHYTIDVQMRLSAVSGHCSYDAKATVYYMRSSRGWELEMIKSRGISMVRTHRYDDCILPSKGSGYLNSEDLYFENDCEVALEVGGRIYKYGSWRKFSLSVPSHTTQFVEYYVEDFVIDYVERP